MKDLEMMKQIWLEQPIPDAADAAHNKAIPGLPSRLEGQLRLFEQENGATSYLVATLVMLVLGGLFLFGILRQDMANGWLAAGGFWLASSVFGWYYIRSRQLARHDNDESVHAYIRAKYQQLGLYARLRWLRVGAAVLVGLGMYLAGGSPGWADLEGRSLIAVVAFGGVAVLLAGVLAWWYQTQHPYQLKQLRRDLRELLDQFDQQDATP